MTEVSPELLTGIAAMAETLDQSEFAFAHLTCSEADSVVAVLAVAGHLRVAISLVIGHATDDEDGDQHYAVHEAWVRYDNGGDRAEMLSLAHAYVAELVNR
jgi:hypothetical protein